MAMREKYLLKSASPIKMGLLIVAASYFLFTLHALFTLQWIGEWNGLKGSAYFFVFTTDISAFLGLIFRFIASLIAIGAVIFYFNKTAPPIQKTYKLLRWVLILEAIYWLSTNHHSRVEHSKFAADQQQRIRRPLD